jgi:hypothetical protein
VINRIVVEPRLTAEYTDLADAPEPMLPTIAAVLARHYGVPCDGLWMNYYRDHRDSTGWHGDWPTCKRHVRSRRRSRLWVHSPGSPGRGWFRANRAPAPVAVWPRTLNAAGTCRSGSDRRQGLVRERSMGVPRL